MTTGTNIETIKSRFFTFGDKPDDPFVLQSGESFGPITIAYETYGTLSPEKDNAILVFHALSGSQHASGFNPSVPEANGLWTDDCTVGWWNDYIGPGKAFDTNEFFVVCANYLGGCYGSTGPRSLNPDTGIPYGGSFPIVSISDIVDSQIRLLDHLGIGQLHAVAGSSIGGLLALNFSTRYSERTQLVISISSGLQVSILQRILNLEQIYAIEEDPNFHGGDYYNGERPNKGLALARMIAHKSYISLDTMERRARGEIVQPEPEFKRYRLTHPVESYMLHQGRKFVERFDANTYLRILSAWQRFDILQDAGAENFRDLFSRCRDQRYLVFSIDSDVCYYPDEQTELTQALKNAKVHVQHITAHSEKGHDAFLLEPNLFAPHLEYTLKERYV